MALHPPAMDVCLDFYHDVNPSNNRVIIAITGATLPVSNLTAITPFTSGPRRLCQSFGLTVQWNLEPLSLL
jgi:hypothetical protein